MNTIIFIILCFATWRLSNMLVHEDGPFHVFRRVREWVGIIHDDAGEVLQTPDRFFSNLLSCTWCTSMWVGTVWALLWFFLSDVSVWVAAPFALSAGAILIDKFVER